MTYKNCLKGLIIFLGIIIGISLINTILYYNDLLNSKTIEIIETITLILATIITSFYIGLKSKNKGYINGLITGIVIVVVSLILSLLLKEKITIIKVISYVLIILLSTTSSILGINRKK